MSLLTVFDAGDEFIARNIFVRGGVKCATSELRCPSARCCFPRFPFRKLPPSLRRKSSSYVPIPSSLLHLQWQCCLPIPMPRHQAAVSPLILSIILPCNSTPLQTPK